MTDHLTRHLAPASDLLPEQDGLPPHVGDLVVISGRAIEQAIAAMALFADVAGEPAVVGGADTAQIHSHLPASAYRRIREVRRLLMEEFANG